MFARFTMIVCKITIFCVLGTFVLSASFKSYCDSTFCYKKYDQEFDSGSIKSISFEENELTKEIREKEKREYSDESYRRSILEGYPSYDLNFVIIDGNRAIDFKNVIFDGVEAEISVFTLFEPSAQLVEIKDFQMGPFGGLPKLLKFIFPAPVTNTFSISLRRGLINKLKQKDRLKITLVSYDDRKFVLEMDNFIKKYDF
ncbi:hypothetical protein CNO14_04500 (plasmid) [Borrelia miyamotoi]|uniref:Protein BptA n=1 Tax=Borrelia miyamotoi TaxID=47466 RepID=A0AAP9CG91_9SPIR|nr:hypothetical protein [Borrelia miyamotoi]AHH05471.1 hypothetical protein BOM_0928 [Borrelia miyamotoi FR64b]ATQ15266.1 hypothetical protein CNO14_04500 [Borrelia miyamotoi]ATQ16422.1 hypothetical protein CNO13_04365 [Borrelia miyamotoi]ATQ17595.1 hypothetical protein CNO12_04505 [Borrelia miyamotoi]ATQ18839.1 hypothetical protein CNO11_04495 [Borrelia miyamotoi]